MASHFVASLELAKEGIVNLRQQSHYGPYLFACEGRCQMDKLAPHSELLLQQAKVIEAVIFASQKPVRARELSAFLEDETQLPTVIAIIDERYGAYSGVELVRRDDAYAFFAQNQK